MRRIRLAMMLIAYIALGTAFTIFLYWFTIRQFPIHNSSALSNVVTAFVMWPIQAIFLIIALTVINHFRASDFEQHFQFQCGTHAGARLALLVMLIQLLFLTRIIIIGARSHRQIAGSIQADFNKLMKG